MINDERHRFSRRVWDPLISYYKRGKQLLPIFESPDDLLSGVGADVGRDSGDLDYFNPSGFTRIPAVLGDEADYGVRFEYAEQPSPDGLAQAFIIGEKFIGEDSACLVLGDNIFMVRVLHGCCWRR